MARLVTNEANARSKSRLVGIRLATLTLRLRGSWSQLFGDADTAAIALAIVAIVSERLLREQLAREQESLTVAMPDAALGACNISSIAAATGMNRETTRRKVNQLTRDGLLIRDGAAIRLAPGFTQQREVIEMINTQLDELRRTANDLLRVGAITIEN